MERDPVRDTGFAGVGLGQFDRRLVEVEAVHGGVGIAKRDGDGGPAGAAGDIRHSRAGLQLRVYVGDLWQVLGGEQVHQPRAVEIALRLDGVRSETPFVTKAEGMGDRFLSQSLSGTALSFS